MVLEIKSIGKIYNKKRVVQDISFSVRRGEILGLLGPNGAGKTTSFYIAVGLVYPDFGSVVLDGKKITNLPLNKRANLGIGYLPQEASIFRGLNVEDNIMAILEIHEPVYEKRQTRLEGLLADFSIEHLRKASALSLSGGERRRVEIARALANRPQFIFLDEPFAGIDPIVVNDIKKLVKDLKRRGIGVVITDHNVRETLSIVDRACIVSDGMVLAEGTPREIAHNSKVRNIYLGQTFTL
jgi:lipopolysaccharide export system ATP-binding protein